MSVSFEKEKNVKKSFFDVEISQENGTFVTTNYQKPTISDDQIRLDSF